MGCQKLTYREKETPLKMVRGDFWGGEKACAGGYRYGFNGKENDPETGTQDYGFRIYNPQLGRFLSVDPITREYPELTPYQFASNRPIDGIDLDGLEYVTFKIYIDKSQKVTKIETIKDYELKKFNNNGPGVEYRVVLHNGMTNEVRFVKNRYGIYQGRDNPKLPKVGGDYKKEYYDYRADPIDETDATAKQHDIDYDNAAPGGLEGAPGVMDKRSTSANEKYIEKATKIIQKFDKGEKDEVTGKPVTKEAADAAKDGRFWFRKAEKIK